MLAAELVADIDQVITPDSASSSPRDFVDVGGIRFSQPSRRVTDVNSGERRYGIWNNTRKDLVNGSRGSGPQELINVNGTLYFTAADDRMAG